MMSKRAMIVLIGFALCLFYACGAGADVHEPQNQAAATDRSAPTTEGPILFDTMSDFSKYQHGTRVLSELCVMPARLLEGGKLEGVEVAENVYIALKYSIPGSPANNFSSSYESTMAQTITYAMYLYDNPQVALENGFTKNGYQLVEGSDSIYCYPEISTENGEVVFYSFVFIENGKLILVNLPAVYEAEALLPFVAVRFVECADLGYE